MTEKHLHTATFLNRNLIMIDHDDDSNLVNQRLLLGVRRSPDLSDPSSQDSQKLPFYKSFPPTSYTSSFPEIQWCIGIYIYIYTDSSK